MSAMTKLAEMRPGSLSMHFRQRRLALLRSLIESIPPPVKILDVGGTQEFWERLDWPAGNLAEITLLNINANSGVGPRFRMVIGDARDMGRFREDEFDVVFSNSVIEHVGDYSDQARMASEIKRVGRRVFLQTPNFYFPVEPHFMFIGFQFLPLSVKTWLLLHFNLGWYPRKTDSAEALAIAGSIRLVSHRDLQRLFPGAKIVREKILGLTKSFVVCQGWA